MMITMVVDEEKYEPCYVPLYFEISFQCFLHFIHIQSIKTNKKSAVQIMLASCLGFICSEIHLIVLWVILSTIESFYLSVWF